MVTENEQNFQEQNAEQSSRMVVGGRRQVPENLQNENGRKGSENAPPSPVRK
jgi:hypothetical protein